MKDTIAMILAGGRVEELGLLTLHRPKSAVPYGGLYRIIDFPLSNLMYSGIENVGILSQYRPTSLIAHVGTGESWDFIGSKRCVRILPPYKGEKDSDWYKGTADAVYQNIGYIESFNAKYVLIISGDHVYRMDYGQIIEFHKEKEAELTIGFIKVQKEGAERFGLANLDKDGEVKEYFEKPTIPKSDLASLTIYLFNKDILLEKIKENSKEKSHEFGKDIIPKMIGKNRVFGYLFEGYWGYTRTIEEYWESNMDVLHSRKKMDLSNWGIRTNLENILSMPPAYFGKNAVVSNSFVAPGCFIDGEVEESILFPGVKIGKNSFLDECIIMHNTIISEDVNLKKVIADKNVFIEKGCKIGNENEIKLIGKGSVVKGVGK
ncbi:MAG: glucose-1-phosphate adenylyltransferase subunit GlgD [Candidatus Thermoplasmatota archaeon]